MIVARIVGLVLLVIGIVAGALITLEPLQTLTIQSPAALWALFALAFIGGTLLLTAGAPQRRVGAALAIDGAILLVYALAAAIMLLLANVGVARLTMTDSSWFVFLGCIPTGLVALIAGVALTRTHAMGART